MIEETLSDDIDIIDRGTESTPQGSVPWVHYRRKSTGHSWIVKGVCNQCGLCVVGVDEPWNLWVGPPGTPYSNIDTRVKEGRKDVPVSPGFFKAMELMAKEVPSATVNGCSLYLGE